MRKLPLMLASLFLACGPVQRPHPGGFDGGVVDAAPVDAAGPNEPWPDGGPGKPSGNDGGNNLDCSEGAKLIYVVDNPGNLMSFKPNQTDITKSVFTKVGLLTCAPHSASSYPYSMSVDRSGTAWVEYYANGASQLYQVSITDASCKPTMYTSGQEGFGLFGMGFSANKAMSKDETLFIAGSANYRDPNVNLGLLDTKNLMVSKIGAMKGGPELTGNALGELWGFFPATQTNSRVRISQLDKKTGAESNTIDLTRELSGTSVAWAFAYYGGDFWVFLSTDTTLKSTTVYQVGHNGLKAKYDVPYLITGAGVSTCAPVAPIP